jgi:hypothetical protein
LGDGCAAAAQVFRQLIGLARSHGYRNVAPDADIETESFYHAKKTIYILMHINISEVI